MNCKRLGVMIDCSRNAVMKPETLKRFMGYIKKAGYNAVYLYMEDTYEVDGEPYFGHLRGRYTQSELREINDFCVTEGVESIPCIQTLAHLNQIFKWNEYKPINDCSDILLTNDARTEKLIENMFSSLRKCFDTHSINIGMDEAHLVGRGKYLDKNGYETKFEVISKHLKKVIAIAEKYGFKPTMWSDMFFRPINNDWYYLDKIDKKVLADVKKYVPEEVTLCYWDYHHNTIKHYDTQIKAHKFLTDKVAFAGGCCSWLGFAPMNKGAILRMKAAMDSCRKNDINDVILTIWGDNGKEGSSFAMLPSLYFCAQRYLYGATLADVKKGFKQVYGVNFETFLKLDLPNSVRGNVWGYPCKWGLYNDPLSGIYDYHIATGDGKIYEKHARSLAISAKNANEFSYLFNHLSRLCKVMSLKFDLGVRTREAYLAGDKETLKKIVDKDYPLLLKRLNDFYNGFLDLWEYENKPNGFDVQDIRLGGLEKRLKHCRKTIKDYLAGKTDSISELEAPVLPYEKGKEKTADLIGPYDWAVTPNVL